jgi:aryl-alcohol dehydrogenase-like predicted oxidoreductase
MTNPRPIAHAQVNPIGLGCMNLSHAYGTPISRDNAVNLLNQALDLGYDSLDTAALYGFGANETLIGQAISHRRKDFFLASKCGMTGVTFDDGVRRVIDGRPATIKATCEASLKRLNTDVIDLYYLHRWDKKVPIEESVGAMGDLITQGKIRSIGLSEVSASTLRKAHKEHPIAAVQSEYSLWSRNPEIAVLQACQELSVAFVAFSPLGRAYLTGELVKPESLEPKDIRLSMPRFSPPVYAKLFDLLAPYKLMARDLGCSPAQLALAWLLHKAPHIHVIPGTGNPAHLIDNVQADQITLDAKQCEQLNQLINENTVAVLRYNAQALSEVDTEEFAHHH